MYRKFTADQIFTGRHFLPGSEVLITDGSGTIVDIVAARDAGDGIEIFDGVLSPGFINCHCHLELSHMKEMIPKNTGLVDFALKIIRERNVEQEVILSAIENAENEMFENGIVAVGDISNTPFTLAQKRKGRLHYQNFIELAGFPPSVATKVFQRGLDLYKSFASELPDTSIVPHAPYSVSAVLFNLIDEFPNNRILSIHNQESPAENELFEVKKGDLLRLYEKLNIDISFFKPSGHSSLQTFLPYFKNDHSLILVHNVFTSAGDVDFVHSLPNDQISSLYFCFCPNANLYISSVLPDLNVFTANSEKIVLGTDSLASNDHLSILEEIKTLHKYFPGIRVDDLLRWGTINGSIALGINKTYGSFEKGKRPGIILISGMDDLQNATAKRIL